jgi:hypothetical protein
MEGAALGRSLRASAEKAESAEAEIPGGKRLEKRKNIYGKTDYL